MAAKYKTTDSQVGSLGDKARASNFEQIKNVTQREGTQGSPDVDSSARKKPFWKEWWFISIFAGAIAGVLAAILIPPAFLSRIGWRLPVAIGAVVTAIMLLRNPKRRYMNAFWSVFGALCAWNILPGLEVFFRKSENGAEISFGFILESMHWIVSVGMILTMVFLLYFDLLERREKAA